MKSRKFPVVLTICVVVCIAAAIGFAMLHSLEAFMALDLPLEFIPQEYSSDGGETWKPIVTGGELLRQRKDVSVRGHFNFDMMEGWFLNLNFHHMQMELFVNGECIATHAREFHEIDPVWCTDMWMCFCLPEIHMNDEVEFRLYSLHPAGAEKGAYMETLSSMKLGEPFYMYQKVSGENAKEQYAGLTLIIVGLVIFAIAFVALWMRSPLQKVMMYTALFAVGEGLFWVAEAAEITHYVNNSIVFFSTGRFVSRILCIYALLCAVSELLKGKAKSIAQMAATLNGGLIILYLTLNMADIITFCEGEQIWYCVQAVLVLVVLFCGLWDCANVHRSFWQTLRLLSLLLALIALLYDMGTLLLGWYTEMQLSKWVCASVAAVHATALLVQLPASFAAIRRAEKLSEELHNSRIVLAMSQIRTHFIFNVLNAISSLCKSDPELADRELIRFSRYLRNNIDIMQEDRPIPFEQALEHVHNYVDLEQLRFGEKIILDENFEYVHFNIPSLVMQPLVENAIKHGLLPKDEGGMIRLTTVRCGNEVLIEIADNGVGFDTRKKIEKTSVGLSNVRFRVENMLNGRMQVQSVPGEGTLVRLWLPLEKEESPFTLSV
ncbi:MAG: histidine kinase [Clostridia bacterium]|nr:histidine kinase [Clostridia bacterium]